MTDINPQAVKTKTVKTAYDLAVAHFEAADTLQEGVSPQDHARDTLIACLTEAGYNRAGQVAAILNSHETAVSRGKAQRHVAADGCAQAAALFQATTGKPLPEDKRVAAQADAASPTASAGADAPDPRTTAPMDTTTFAVDAQSRTLIDPTVATVTGGAITSIDALLSAIDAATTARDALEASIAAHDAAIAAYAGGAEKTEEPEDASVDHTPSGLVGCSTDHALRPVLDSQLASGLTPPASFDELIATLAQAEDAVTTARATLRDRKRDLRKARPRTRVAAGPTAAAQADSLSEIEAIDASCEVVQTVATDLFPRCYGATPEILNFDVPKLEFDSPHPDVPAIDESFRFFTGVLPDALSAIADNEILWLYGDSGCGKSEFWAQVAAHLNMPFTRINLDGHLTRSDIVGGMKLVSDGQGGQETRFVDGKLLRAMSRPGLLLLDEFDLGDPEIMPVFQPILEGNAFVVLEDGGRIVHPHPMFRIAITGNTIGLGSDNQMYLNAFEQSAATRDRIAAFVEMPYMPASIEKEVVLQRNPDADETFVDKLIQLAGKVRAGYAAGELHSLFSTRAVQVCARRHARFAPLYPTEDQAAQEVLSRVILNRLDAASHQKVKGFIDNIF